MIAHADGFRPRRRPGYVVLLELPVLMPVPPPTAAEAEFIAIKLKLEEILFSSLGVPKHLFERKGVD